ncbi:MAG: DUF4437 domain-containing protein [Phycisphaerales bacterium JB050]
MTLTFPSSSTRPLLRVLAPVPVLLLGGCASMDATHQDSSTLERVGSDVRVVTTSDVQWGALNPARGAAGPRAGDLWGDRTGSSATGFLVRFGEGFSSPPHIHNITYRGIVIDGLIHNDDPEAEESWMPSGSYWTQPAGEVHITAARGDGRLAYIEIQDGPYLVMPPEEASDTGERALNLHAGNMVWLDASSSNRITLPAGVQPGKGPKISFLWGDPQDESASGAMVRVPSGCTVTLQSDDPMLRAVVIKGQAILHRRGGLESQPLEPGSFVGATGGSNSRITMSASEACWLYVRGKGAFSLVAAPAE